LVFFGLSDRKPLFGELTIGSMELCVKAKRFANLARGTYPLKEDHPSLLFSRAYDFAGQVT
jgi:hypothetical protein